MRLPSTFSAKNQATPDVEPEVARIRRAVTEKLRDFAVEPGEKGWLREALVRTEDYYKNGPRGPIAWVLNLGGHIPAGAFNGLSPSGIWSNEPLEPVYVARGYTHGGIQVGKASKELGGAVMGWNWDEFRLDLYEILIASPEDVEWVEGSRGRLDLSALSARPVEGGYESNAEALFVAQAYHEHVWRPGKHSVGLPNAHIPHGGREILIDTYRILCYVE